MGGRLFLAASAASSSTSSLNYNGVWGVQAHGTCSTQCPSSSWCPSSSQSSISPQNSPPTPSLFAGKQLVHYTAQPLFLVDSSAVDVGSGDLPIFFELGEGPYFTDGDEYVEDPTISLLSGTEQAKPKDPAVS